MIFNSGVIITGMIGPIGYYRGYYVRAREERNQLKGEVDGHRQ